MTKFTTGQVYRVLGRDGEPGWSNWMDKYIGQLVKIIEQAEDGSYKCIPHSWESLDEDVIYLYPKALSPSTYNTVCPYCRSKAFMDNNNLYCSNDCPQSIKEQDIRRRHESNSAH